MCYISLNVPVILSATSHCISEPVNSLMARKLIHLKQLRNADQYSHQFNLALIEGV
jgi:hypothetical protein